MLVLALAAGKKQAHATEWIRGCKHPSLVDKAPTGPVLAGCKSLSQRKDDAGVNLDYHHIPVHGLLACHVQPGIGLAGHVHTTPLTGTIAAAWVAEMAVA